MAVETTTNTEKKICNSCGADVRPNTTFCYNCGSSLAGKSSAETILENQKSNLLQSNAPDVSNGNSAPIEPAQETIVKPIEKPFAEPLIVKNESPKIEKEKSEPDDKPALKTAASMRRAKPAQSKRVEVVWEQPENSTSIWFVVFALVLILLAAGALLAMLYLK